MSNLFAQSKSLKFEDFVHYRNINLVKNSTEKNGPASFKNFFIQTQEIHQHNTKHALNNLYHNLEHLSAIAWNTVQYELGFNFQDYDSKTLKKRFFNSLFASYQE